MNGVKLDPEYPEREGGEVLNGCRNGYPLDQGPMHSRSRSVGWRSRAARQSDTKVPQDGDEGTDDVRENRDLVLDVEPESEGKYGGNHGDATCQPAAFQTGHHTASVDSICSLVTRPASRRADCLSTTLDGGLRAFGAPFTTGYRRSPTLSAATVKISG